MPSIRSDPDSWQLFLNKFPSLVDYWPGSPGESVRRCLEWLTVLSRERGTRPLAARVDEPVKDASGPGITRGVSRDVRVLNF